MFARLAGKTALITGASSGLGRHFAGVLARAGANVILCGRRQAALLEVAGAVADAGGTAHTIGADLTQAQSIGALEAMIQEVDIVINNAGIVHSAPSLDQTEADWDSVMDTNLKAAFLVAQAAARAMRSHGRGGSIINIASILGLRQTSGVLPYTVSKAGVVQMTKVLALELARFGIRVNALAPGYLDTEMNNRFLGSSAGQELVRRIPMRRSGRLEELDGPLMLLASDDSSYMTGSVITVDGGHMVNGL